jgi:hypothetical protein
MIDFQVRGAAELRAAARQLRIEQKALRAGAVKAIERGVRKLRVTIPAAAGQLPSGYATVMAADVRVSTSVRLSGRDPVVGVKVWAPGKGGGTHRDVEAIDAGVLRHPLFGDRGRWYAQVVRPSFASEPFQDAKPAILDELENDWNDMVSRVERG